MDEFPELQPLEIKPDKERVAKAFSEYQDGAITYVEFLRFAWSQVTEEDVLLHNQNGELGREMDAEWPFEG